MWLILADDLTGAADCAIAFARRGVPSVVGWGAKDANRNAPDRRPPDGYTFDGHTPDGHTPDGHVPAGHATVFAYNADSRAMPPDQVAVRHQVALDRLGNRRLFVKIDSTLRGQPAAAIDTAMAALRARDGAAFGILAPAFPATGRTTEGGRVLVGGVPLERTELWQRDRSYASADLLAMLATAGVAGRAIPLAEVRGAGLRTLLGGTPAGVVAVCDAVVQDDLDRVARAAPSRACFIGSAGLAHALAAAMPERPRRVAVTRSTQGALLVVASLAEATRAAARDLARLEGVRYVPVSPEALHGGPGAAGVIEALDGGCDVLVELVDDRPGLATEPALAVALAAWLRPAAAHVGGVAATGGDTAAALLDAFGVDGIRLAEEIEPGVPLGVTTGALAVPVATKAGAFGDRHSLVRIVRRLRQIRQQGTLA